MTQHYLKGVTTLKLDKQKCTGCGICITVCPHRVFELEGNKVAIINPDHCMECTACALNCRWQALSVNKGTGCAVLLIKEALHIDFPKTSSGC